MRKLYILIVVLAVALDRLTKWLIVRNLSLADHITVIPGMFTITHVHNQGAAFGLFSDSTWEWRTTALVAFSFIALLVVGYLLWRSHHLIGPTAVGLALIFGGAIGNLWDRVSQGYVVDFLHFYIGIHEWPDFNVADCCIVVGAFLLMFDIIFVKNPSENTA